jgi:hypothetical protein
MAHLGLLADAGPMSRDGEPVAGLGALVSVRFLVHRGVWHIARTLYGNVGPALRGQRTTLLTLFLIESPRVQRPELKVRDPTAGGRLLGLDRETEIKTLRRAFGRLATHY